MSLGEQPGVFAAELFKAGVDWIQLRDRHVSDERLFRLAIALVAARDEARISERNDAREAPHEHTGPATRRAPPVEGPASPSEIFVIINRRIDIVLAAGADGVHLGFDAIEALEARALLGDGALVGASLHSHVEIEPAIRSGVSYAHLAPIWNPISKPASRPALGLELLSHAAEAGLPLLAQGGVESSRCAGALAAGALGIAVTGSIAKAGAPFAVAAGLRRELDRAS